MSKSKIDVYQMVTDRIIEALEQGRVPWKKKWKGGEFEPQNYVSGHKYRGINYLLAGLSPYDVPYFMTFKQAKEQGGHVKKGAKSLPIVFFKFLYQDKDGKRISAAFAENRKDIQRIPLARYFRVFNIEDIEGIPFDLPQDEPLNDLEKIAQCEQIAMQMQNPPKVREVFQKRACYSPFSDTVTMPVIGQFETAEEFHSTKFHELIHATGHSSRLNREGITEEIVFGSPIYSKEELTAEIGAAFLCNKAGIETPNTFTNSASYIGGWLERLQGDKNFIFVAARQARDAVGFILGE